MTRKSDGSGVFTALGRAADESLDIASAIRAGRLTRHQFESWYEKRRGESRGLVITLRDKTAELAKPVESAIVRGEELLRSVAPGSLLSRPARHHRRRAAKRAARKSKAK